MVLGKFIERPNRFIAKVQLDCGEEVIAHVPNTGRLKELLVPGVTASLSYNPAAHRKTHYTLYAVLHNGIWVGIYSAIANKIGYGYFKEKPEIRELKSEVRFQKSRLDLGFCIDETPWYFEIKSVNLQNDGVAMFPDAPTERGARHLRELMCAKEKGYEAGVLFVVQREDVKAFTPNVLTDPNFSKTLSECVAHGVTVKVLRCKVDETSINIIDHLPMIL